MTARERLIQRIVAEGCDGHGAPGGDDEYEHHGSDDCPDGNACADCECWAHLAQRAIYEAEQTENGMRIQVATLTRERGEARFMSNARGVNLRSMADAFDRSDAGWRECTKLLDIARRERDEARASLAVVREQALREAVDVLRSRERKAETHSQLTVVRDLISGDIRAIERLLASDKRRTP